LKKIIGDTRIYKRDSDRDPGTGLLNKAAIEDYCRKTLQLITPKKCTWLAILDVDEFKAVNDSYGHAFGDKILLEMARLLEESVGDAGMAGRFGGDEFFFCLEDASEYEVRGVLEKLLFGLPAASERLMPGLKVTISAGVISSPLNPGGYDELFALADKALYIAKGKGRNRYIIYREEMHANYVIPGNTKAFSYSKNYMERITLAVRDNTDLLFKKGMDALPEVVDRLRDEFQLDYFAIYSGKSRKCVYCTGEKKDVPFPEWLLKGIMEDPSSENTWTYASDPMIGRSKEEHPRLCRWLKRRKGREGIFSVIKDEEGNPGAIFVYNSEAMKQWAVDDAYVLMLMSDVIHRIKTMEDMRKKDR